MSDPPQGPVSVCPRCGGACAGQVWCQQCGLNLRARLAPQSGTETSGQSPAAPTEANEPPAAPPPRSWSTPPPTPFARAWERLTRTVDPMVAAAIAVGIALIAVVALVAVATKGGGKSPQQLPGVADVSTLPTETTSTETTPTETTATETTTTPSVESSQVEQVLGEYTQDYSNEDLEAFKGLFAGTLERRDGNKAPEDLEAALATYQRQFGELQKPSYTLSSESVQPGTGEASATARYSISSQNGTVTGTIAFHLIEQEGKLLIDKLTVTPSK